MVTTAALPRPTWEQFRTQFEHADAPQAFPLDGEPAVHLFISEGGRRFGLRSPAEGRDVLPASPLVELELQVVRLDGGPWLEVSTTNPSLFPYFYAFAISVAHGIQVDRKPAVRASGDALGQWKVLLQQVSLLSPERQLGLLGELWLLERLTRVLGVDALGAWTGPAGEAHDFRFADLQLEVKVTGGERRVHQISSETQLVASPGHRLHLLSLQYAPAGPASGRSIADAVDAVCTGLRHGGGDVDRFDDVLRSSYSVTPDLLPHYQARMELRTRPYLVPVDVHFPRIARSDVLSVPRREMQRVSDVRYRLDVEGLGWEDGTPEFLEIIPEV